MSQTRVMYTSPSGAKFELEGSAEFVEAHLTEFLELTQQPNVGGANGTAGVEVEADTTSENGALPRRAQSLRQFFEQKDSRNVYEAIACAIYYAGKYDNRPELAPQEIRDLLVQAKYRPPGNISQALVDCRRKYGFVEVGSKKGLWKLSHQGETMVEFDLPRSSSTPSN
jgi:hypothetical protein